jgi:hypothetical protein
MCLIIDLLRLNTKLVDSISELGAIIMRLAYGITVSEENDRYLQTAEAAISTYVLTELFE